METNRAPGLGGLILLYYQTFSALLVPRLVHSCNTLLHGEDLPAATLSAHTTLIPKEGRDGSDCANYHPIFLLNVDLKIFTTVLFIRLLPFLPSLVHNDQVGFIPFREARDDTCRAFNLVYLVRSWDIPKLLISADVEKAFDWVNWLLLKRILRHVGLGHQYVHMGRCNIFSSNSCSES